MEITIKKSGYYKVHTSSGIVNEIDEKPLKIQTPNKFISSIESADKKTLKEITSFMRESLKAANKNQKDGNL